MDVIPESSALMVLDKDLLAMLVGLSVAFCELWSLAFMKVETMSHHCWEVILTQTWVEMHNAAQPKRPLPDKAALISSRCDSPYWSLDSGHSDSLKLTFLLIAALSDSEALVVNFDGREPSLAFSRRPFLVG